MLDDTLGDGLEPHTGSQWHVALSSARRGVRPGAHQQDGRVAGKGRDEVMEQNKADDGALYGELSQTYRAIDDFRMKLLGLLPLATGTGVFLLVNGKMNDASPGANTKQFLLAIGIFGFLFTFGLFAYELHGIEKCGRLIITGKRIEADLRILGQFTGRPEYVAGFINEPFASSIIYSASLAAWAFLGLSFISREWALGTAVGVFCVSLGASLVMSRLISRKLDRELTQGFLEATLQENASKAHHQPV